MAKLLISLLSFQPVYAAFAQCAPEDDQGECAVLIEIAAMGVTANTANGWLGGGTFCEWSGITCNTVPNTPAELILNEALQRRQLTRLVLDSQGLAGQLTSNIATFTQLDRISLENNKITGPVPAFTSNVHVKKIVLSSNLLTGVIPDLSMNTKLEYLFLQNNQLTGQLPASLSTLSNMEWLGFGDNKLTGPVPSLAKLDRLKAFWMSNNQISGTFPSLANANSLQILDIRSNQLEGIDVGICDVSTPGFFRQPISTFYDKNSKCAIAYNPFDCKKLPTCARSGCDADSCIDVASGTREWFDSTQYDAASFQTWDEGSQKWTTTNYPQVYPAASS